MNALPFNVWSFCGVKGCLLVFVVVYSFPIRLLSPNVFVPQIATANSFTNKQSWVLFFYLGPGLFSKSNFNSWVNLIKIHNKTIKLLDCVRMHTNVRYAWSVVGVLTNKVLRYLVLYTVCLFVLCYIVMLVVAMYIYIYIVNRANTVPHLFEIHMIPLYSH